MFKKAPALMKELLTNRIPADGQHSVLECTFKEHAQGKFEPPAGQQTWTVYMDKDEFVCNIQGVPSNPLITKGPILQRLDRPHTNTAQ